MNRFNFLQTGLFPLELDSLQLLAEAMEVFNSLGSIAGNKTILSGCTLIGSTVSDGYVHLDGEVFPFKGGNIQTSVKVFQNVTQKEFQDGQNKDVFFERYVGFGSGANTIPWSEFQRITPIITLQRALTPIGGIIMWSGGVNDIPTNWKLCNGVGNYQLPNGQIRNIPNLAGKFIVGFDGSENADIEYDAVGKIGGSKKVTPSASTESKSVSITVSRDGWNTTGSPLGSAVSGRLIVGSGQNENGESLESLRAAGTNQNFTGSHSHSVTVQEIDKRPPYYTLAYIIYTGN